MGRGPRHLFRRLSKERYASRRFENPFFRRPSKKHNWMPWAIAVLAASVPLGALGFALGSPKFDITDAEVVGTTTVSPQEVGTKVESYLSQPFLFVFHRRNRFLFNQSDLKAAISSSYAFDRIDVERKEGHVTVKIQEKVPRLVWRSGEHWYFVDGSGTVIREITKEEAGQDDDPAKPLPRFLDVDHADVTVGNTVLSKDEAANALTFQELLRAQNILFGTTRVDRLAGEWMSVETADGFSVLFDPIADVAKEAANLDAVLRNEVKDRAALSYVDVRFGDHVYFK